MLKQPKNTPKIVNKLINEATKRIYVEESPNGSVAWKTADGDDRPIYYARSEGAREGAEWEGNPVRDSGAAVRPNLGREGRCVEFKFLLRRN